MVRIESVEQQLKKAKSASHLSEEKFRRLVESVKDYAIFMLSADGIIESWNAGAQRTKGYTAEEIIGRPMSTFYLPEDQRAGRPAKLLALATKDGSVEDIGWRVKKDGTTFWADVTITAIRDDNGELVGFAKVTRDLTDRRTSEEERVRLAQAQEAIRLRDEFLSIAAHELRTPLTALQLQLDTLKERVQRVEAGLLPNVERAKRTSQRLTALTDTLLDVARISTGRLVLSLSDVDLTKAVHEAVDRLAETAKQAASELNLQLEPGVTAHCDLLRIEQVVSNLISNAIKYAAGTKVDVSLKREADHAVIVVRDHGQGIPEAAHARIFERFERAASFRHYSGLGLGLYVAREIVHAHGGDISARNANGGGAEFTVRLPLVAHPPASH